MFFFGQVLSMLTCGTGVTSQLLTNRGINIPTSQTFVNYVLLMLVFGAVTVRRGMWLAVLRRRWRSYALFALLDVEANYCVVKAYQYTNITSIQILDCVTIPVVMLLSYLVLRVRYERLHYVGVLTCMGGLAAIIAADFETKNSGEDGGKEGDNFSLSFFFFLFL